MSYYCIIDRFEGDYAVCELATGQMVSLLKSELPQQSTPGCVLQKTETGFCIDETETQKRRKKIAELQARLFQKK